LSPGSVGGSELTEGRDPKEARPFVEHVGPKGGEIKKGNREKKQGVINWGTAGKRCSWLTENGEGGQSNSIHSKKIPTRISYQSERERNGRKPRRAKQDQNVKE